MLSQLIQAWGGPPIPEILALQGMKAGAVVGQPLDPVQEKPGRQLQGAWMEASD